MTVVVDPYLLTLPDRAMKTDEVREFAINLINWDARFQTEPDYVVSSKAMNIIYKLGLYIDKNALEDIFEKLNIYELSAMDVVNGCERLIANSPQMEERAAALDVNCLVGSEEIIPPQIRDRMHPEVAKAFTDALVTTSYALEIIDDQDVWSMATAPLSSYASLTAMDVKGSVDDKGTSISISRTWPLIFDPNQFRLVEQIVDIYEADCKRATTLAWEELSCGRLSFPKIDKPYTFGDKFLSSLREPAFQKRPGVERDLKRVFEAIVFVMTNLWSYGSDKNHALRKDIKSRTGDQITRKSKDGIGSDKAGRAEVMGGGNCIRLHYWICHDGSYEFSNVTVEHDDGTIFK